MKGGDRAEFLWVQYGRLPGYIFGNFFGKNCLF